MATIPKTRAIQYPTSDGKPVAETEVHRDEMMDLIRALNRHFADDRNICISGNMLMFYVEGDRHKHISPDVFVTLGIPKRRRENYLVWEEGKAPDLVIELTSKSTRKDDIGKKFNLYQDVLKVREYFLFDPYQDYLKPPFQGHRLVEGQYRPIEPVAGRLPSEVIGLHLERDGMELRLFNTATRAWLEWDQEALQREAQGRRDAEEELARLRRELEALKARPPGEG